MTLVRLAIAAGVLCAASGCAIVDSQQRHWIFQPGQRTWDVGAQASQGMSDVWIEFTSADGPQPVKLHGLWLPHVDADAPVMLYLHGARWDVRSSAPRMRGMYELGFSVLGIDYRGFGKSNEALPSEDLTHEDALAAWHWLAQQWPQAARYLYGHSLGASIAVRVASETGAAAGVIVEGGFTSALDVANSTRWRWLPLQHLITQRLDAGSRIDQVKAPLLVVHGGADTMVPHELGRALYERAKPPKRFVLLDGIKHHEIVAADHAPYRQAVADLFGVKMATR
jgi:alpha-beta hydrolase superfamily lysophospholipase